MGWVIDTFGQRDSMATGFGQVLAALGAVPVAQPGHDPENLTAGMLAVLPALLISGVVLLAGIAPLAPRDGPDARQAPGGTDPPGRRAALLSQARHSEPSSPGLHDADATGMMSAWTECSDYSDRACAASAGTLL